MKTKNLIKGAVVASVLAMAGQTVFAHGGATGVVKERMDGMSVMKDAMKVLTPMMRGEAEYDASVVRARAEDISRHAGEALTRLFPEGSTDKASEAKPEIWQNWESFAGLADQLRLAADGLVAASENGVMMAGDMPAAGSMMSGQSGAMMGGMMGSGSDGAMMDLSQMPADGVFAMMGQVCAACHTRFRVEK